MKPARFAVVVLVLGLFCISIAQSAPVNVTYTVQTDVNRTPISKYVYGSNWGGGTDYTIRRSGGNRLTAYNWENNWSNAGADWWWENDQYMSDSPIPGFAITSYQNQALSQGQTLIVTLQMADYVSDSVFGMVDCNLYAAPSFYFKKVVFAKGSPFCDPPGSPDTSDANVYMDEFVNFLVYTYGHAGTANGVKFYDLDNEPDLWYATDTSPPITHATHWEVHPYLTNCAEYKDKSRDVSTAVKNVDPNAQIMGPVSYGFTGYLSFQSAPDWTSTWQYQYPWFLSYYLHKMGQDSNTAGKRLLDALDVHWYPEATDGSNHRILDDVKTRNMYTARMQAPRTLWDPGYVSPNETFPNGEVSWINKWYFAQYLPIIPRLKTDIKNYYPDTNLAITEYAYGPDDDPANGHYSHWSTGIATADFLGICGKYGVQVATYWGNGSYVDTAIKMYTNYNGAKGKFGDMNVPAGMSDKTNSSMYASVFANDANTLHMIVINKNQDSSINGTFNITSSTNFTVGRVFMFDGNSPAITERTGISGITGNSFTYTFPPVSVSHIVLTNYCPPGDLDHDCGVDLIDLGLLADQWLNPSLSCPGTNCADLNADNEINFKDFAVLGPDWRL